MIKNDKEPRIVWIIYTSSNCTPTNQLPKTGKPNHEPVHPKITFEINELKPGLT
jgi:hypothetical protein